MNGAAITWDDLRFFRAVAVSGSLSAAAKTVGASQPTVGRRIAALERALGVKLFVRQGRGFALTDEGSMLLEPAAQMESLVLQIERQARGEQKSAKGELRVSAPPAIGVEWLVEQLAGFSDAFPDVRVTLVTEAALADVERLAVDVALRAIAPSSPRLVARKVGTYRNGLYASETYLDRHAPIRRVADLRDHEWLSPQTDATPWPEAAWMLEKTRRPPVLSTSSFLAIREGIRASMGLGLLPCILESDDTDLVRLLPRSSTPSRSLWLTYHEDLRRNLRVRAFVDYVGDAIEADHDRFQ